MVALDAEAANQPQQQRPHDQHAGHHVDGQHPQLERKLAGREVHNRQGRDHRQKQPPDHVVDGRRADGDHAHGRAMQIELQHDAPEDRQRRDGERCPAEQAVAERVALREQDRRRDDAEGEAERERQQLAGQCNVDHRLPVWPARRWAKSNSSPIWNSSRIRPTWLRIVMGSGGAERNTSSKPAGHSRPNSDGPSRIPRRSRLPRASCPSARRDFRRAAKHDHRELQQREKQQ